MQNTPGYYSPLRFASAEVEVLRDICKEIPADPVDPGQLKDDVVVHETTVTALLEMNLRKHSPFLAYLSACGTGRVRDDDFLDESIHLITAFQLAEFRHVVVGTLWEVNDKLCTEMAGLTYEEIRDGGMTD
ncbi:CHAT domain-containing protein [Xylaria acuta]|nr:CHAT domain-containing protein [Xylaria acuta]